MSRIAFPLIIATALTATACACPKIVRTEPIDGVISGQCHVDRVRGAVGLSASASTIERARVDSDSLDVMILRNPQNAASSRPAYGGQRLVIETGDYNRITAIYCEGDSA